MKNKYVDLEVLKYMILQLSAKISETFRKIKDSYTKKEIDDKFASLSKGMNWKENVNSESDLPMDGNEKGDARVALDTNNIYVWNGTAWVSTGSAANIPMASEKVNGQMSSEDYLKLKNINLDQIASTDYISKNYVTKEYGKSLVKNSDINKIHEHENLNNLNKINEDNDGNMTYNGKAVGGSVDLSNYVQKEDGKYLVADTEIRKIHKHNNLYVLDNIVDNGDGDYFLANDGSYKKININIVEQQDW